MNRRQIGSEYEKIAQNELVKQGFIALERNVYTPFGEIDLVMKRDGVYFFVEVKYRGSDRFGTPKEALNPQKMRRLSLAVRHYMRERKLKQPYRIGYYGFLCRGDALEHEWIEDIVGG